MPATVLLVEDERDIADLVRYHVEKAGMRFIHAADGGTALRLARAEQPDVALLDLMLPGLDGLEVCRQPSSATTSGTRSSTRAPTIWSSCGLSPRPASRTSSRRSGGRAGRASRRPSPSRVRLTSSPSSARSGSTTPDLGPLAAEARRVSANGLRVYVLCGGLLELDLALMLPDRAPGSRWTVPVPAFLVVHGRGRLLFDTGVHCAAITDPVGRLGETRASRFGMRSQPGDEVVSQLGLLGVRPDDVTWVANSHFHFDHCGGNEFFPRSTFLVQRKELEAARDPACPGREALHAERPGLRSSARVPADRRGATTSSATARSCCSRRTATRPATSPSGCARERAATWS